MAHRDRLTTAQAPSDLDDEADTLLALFAQRRYPEAEARARRWTEHSPEDAFGWKILGAILAGDQRYPDAISALNRALDLHPDDAECRNTLGSVFEDLGKFEDACIYYAQAARRAPGFVAAFYNLASLLQKIGRLDEASYYYDHILKIDPSHLKSLNNFGALLSDLKQFDAALDYYQRALTIAPNQPKVLTNMGNLLLEQNRLDEALTCQQRAAQLQPGHPEILSNLGNTLKHLGRFDEALAVYQQSMTILGRRTDIDPKLARQQLTAMLQLSHPETLTIQGNTQQALGQLDEAEHFYRQAIALDSRDASIYSKLLFTLNYHPDKSAEEIVEAYREFDGRFGLPYRSSWRAHPNDRTHERRLRLGYVSPDFRMHSACRFLEPLLACHDHEHFEVIAYAELTQEDALTDRYRGLVDRWVPTQGLSDEELAERIRADGIDILIDLAGHTANNRLAVFAQRPAPVSVSWLGYGYTTGLTAIDYFLTDAIMAPPGSESLFAEQVWRIETPSLVYRPADDMGEVAPLPARHCGHVTFGTLTRSVRLNHRIIRVWSAILRRLPGSRLVIDSKDFATEAMQQRLTERFVEHGIESERLQIGYHSPPWDVLRGIDIGLDCFPHNSGTTLIESLYMGVPFVTLAARPSVGRIGSLILTAAGHPEWIATTEDDYVEKAVALATDLERLASLRATLRTQLEAGPWRDEFGFTQRVERAYRHMWRLWCETAPAP